MTEGELPKVKASIVIYDAKWVANCPYCNAKCEAWGDGEPPSPEWRCGRCNKAFIVEASDE